MIIHIVSLAVIAIPFCILIRKVCEKSRHIEMMESRLDETEDTLLTVMDEWHTSHGKLKKMRRRAERAEQRLVNAQIRIAALSAAKGVA